MKRTPRLLFTVLFVISIGWAQQTPSNKTSATKADILMLFHVMHLRDQMKLVMEQVSMQMRQMTHEQLQKRDPKITDAEIAKLDAQADELTKGMPIDGMLEDMVPVYQKHLSKADVDAMVGFYSSPTGQKILREMPAMTAEGMQAVQPRLRKMMDDAMNKMEQMAKEQQENTPPASK